ncbi:MAG: aldehyde dehydrogenase family protein [Flammeovirgaceae bacterium]|nr:aldehyde dehydrogenase family protein [Flammeovirgaceae bacterium]
MEIAENVQVDVLQEVFKSQQAASLKLRIELLINRKKRLLALRAWIKSNQRLIEQALFQDLKKPVGEVNSTEVFPILSEIKHALSNLDQWARPKKVDAPLTFLGTWSEIHYEPRGVCLIIAPWNYPFQLCIAPLVSALAAGNTAIVKPSEITPHTSALIKRCVEEVFEKNIVFAIEGGVEISKALLSLPFDHIFFTGSPGVGKIVMKAAAEHLTSVTLELGGKSPTIVTSTARISEAAKRISIAKFINNGQTCLAPDYVLVDKRVANELIEALKEEIQNLFAEKGQAFNASPHYGRIVGDKHFQRLNEFIRDAIETGAKLEFGGEINQQDRFIHPIILSNVSHGSLVMNEEIFGPILPVVSYDTLDEAIAIVNSKPKPLALYVFSGHVADRKKVVQSTSSGGVTVNDAAVHFLNELLPFGGVNNSGIGKSHGYYGFLAFSNEKPVLRQKRGMTSFSLFYPPYTKRVEKLFKWFLKLF